MKRQWFVIRPPDKTLHEPFGKKPTLEQMQREVGGYVELIKRRGCEIYLNEEARIDGKSYVVTKLDEEEFRGNIVVNATEKNARAFADALILDGRR